MNTADMEVIRQECIAAAATLESRVRASHDRLHPGCDTWMEHSRDGIDGLGHRYIYTGVGCPRHHLTFQRKSDPDPVRIVA